MAVPAAVCNMLCVMSTIYHDVDFSLPFLDDEGASQGQTFIRVMSFKARPQGRHQTVTSCSPLCLNLYDLQRHTGEEYQLSMFRHTTLVNVYSLIKWG